jgi:hypothetical protein
MSDVLIRIKRAVLAGGYIFTEKALLEMDADALTELDVAESILNATAINKTLRSTSPFRTARQYLYVIQSPTLDGLAIYSRQAAATISKRSAGTGMVNSRARTTPSEHSFTAKELFITSWQRIEAVSPAFFKSRRLKRSA